MAAGGTAASHRNPRSGAVATGAKRGGHCWLATFKASSTASAWPTTFTPRHSCARRLSGEIRKVLRSFMGVAHRIEYVGTIDGVDYYNDSKGTNPDAAIQGIKAMSRPTVLIGGGYDKQSEYDEWIDSFDVKVKCLVLIGQTREKIAECARKHGFDKIRFADTYEECLKLCTELAEPGDAVLLSPACASWGMFPNYEVRGQLFKEYVHGLAE